MTFKRSCLRTLLIVLALGPPTGAPPLLAQKQTGSDGRYWRESLSLMPDDGAETRQTSDGLRPMLDPDLNVLYVIWRKRPDVVQSGWGGPQLMGQDSELTWFGHRTGDGPKEAAHIPFGAIRIHAFSEVRLQRLTLEGCLVNFNSGFVLALTTDR